MSTLLLNVAAAVRSPLPRRRRQAIEAMRSGAAWRVHAARADGAGLCRVDHAAAADRTHARHLLAALQAFVDTGPRPGLAFQAVRLVLRLGRSGLGGGDHRRGRDEEKDDGTLAGAAHGDLPTLPLPIAATMLVYGCSSCPGRQERGVFAERMETRDPAHDSRSATLGSRHTLGSCRWPSGSRLSPASAGSAGTRSVPSPPSLRRFAARHAVPPGAHAGRKLV